MRGMVECIRINVCATSSHGRLPRVLSWSWDDAGGLGWNTHGFDIDDILNNTTWCRYRTQWLYETLACLEREMTNDLLIVVASWEMMNYLSMWKPEWEINDEKGLQAGDWEGARGMEPRVAPSEQFDSRWTTWPWLAWIDLGKWRHSQSVSDWRRARQDLYLTPWLECEFLYLGGGWKVPYPHTLSHLSFSAKKN